MKLIKLTSVLLCFLVLAGCVVCEYSPEESKSDTNSKDSLLHTSEDISETVSEEISEDVSQVLGFVIVDKCNEREVFDDAEDLFYEDENYRYVFEAQPMHEYIIVEYSDGTTQNVKEALEDGNITIADLDRFDIKYFKNPIEE